MDLDATPVPDEHAHRPATQVSGPKSMNADSVKFLIDTVRDMVHMRLNAGQHPQDVLMTAWDFLEHTARVHVDGCYRGQDGKLHGVDN